MRTALYLIKEDENGSAARWLAMPGQPNVALAFAHCRFCVGAHVCELQ